MAVLTTARLTLRPFQSSDLPAVQTFASDPEVVRFMDWGPNTPEQTAAFLADISAASQTRFGFAVLAGADLIGSAELHCDDLRHRRGSLGYTFARRAWGHGYATEAAGALLAFGFDELGLDKVSATCDPDNIGSARVLEKIGMRREGHLKAHLWIRGERRDRLLYAAYRSTSTDAR